MKQLTIISLLALSAFGADNLGVKDSPVTIPIAPTDLQRLRDIDKEETLLKSQWQAIESEKEVIRLRVCVSGKLDTEHCGPMNINPDGKAVVSPQEKAPTPAQTQATPANP